jgi:hypothetical protein
MTGSSRYCKNHLSIPTGLHHSAQGWPDSERAYPGWLHLISTTLKGLNIKDLQSGGESILRTSDFRFLDIISGNPAVGVRGLGLHPCNLPIRNRDGNSLCDLCDSARAMKPHTITAQISSSCQAPSHSLGSGQTPSQFRPTSQRITSPPSP